jgi:branched-chain amino acid transport system ATP-binding protein
VFLELKDLTIRYGKATAVSGVALEVGKGEVVALVGANGAGKTSIIRAIGGFVRPAAGEIWFEGERIDREPPHRMVKRGIAQVPEGRMIFAPMTVRENLLLGAKLRKDRHAVKSDLDDVYEFFPILREKGSQRAGELSGGQQQMLAMGRALMAAPKLILMDEPTAGLAPLLVKEIGRIINQINAAGISVLLVEQNCAMAFDLAKRAYVLEVGSVALHGLACDLAADERVRECYLGGASSN